jgi:sec-independent protein translocase protein TatA
MNLPLANLLGPENWMLIAGVALLLFGKRLPEMGRSIGQGIVEFKKGLQGIDDDINNGSPPSPPTPSIGSEPRVAEYKFDPYTGRPLSGPRL